MKIVVDTLRYKLENVDKMLGYFRYFVISQTFRFSAGAPELYNRQLQAVMAFPCWENA